MPWFLVDLDKVAVGSWTVLGVQVLSMSTGDSSKTSASICSALGPLPGPERTVLGVGGKVEPCEYPSVFRVFDKAAARVVLGVNMG